MKNRDEFSSSYRIRGNRCAGVDEPKPGRRCEVRGYTAKMFTPKREVTVASWNVQMAYQVGQKEIIARELVRYKVNIAALSELRLTGSGQTKIPAQTETPRVTLFYSGGDKGCGTLCTNGRRGRGG
ncbi:unnamed protein product [Heligmosomoides polygyrus]|uniref:Endo/exonuclease/phosphatase domain-containing protein n=1 Tax=Heligmosomoides polygyrus TaxID=6339 RepID=A0A183GAX5_HELPZ|nr:unnamed protein product [Heligmosomoides polygyrus]